MKVGLFDHVERSDRPLATEFDERLKFAVAAEAAGVYCLHVAEHHGTPLNMVPVPGVYLGAVARATSRMRLGPMVYLLPLYSPLRLIEEICMLDHLSRGRLDIGVGRGVSPFELNFHKVAHERSRDIFIDAYACILAGLTSETLSHAGPHFTYSNVPMALRPLQQPHPPFWYGSSNQVGAAWAGERGMHFAANGPTALARENIAAFREARAKSAGPAVPKPEFRGGTAIGLLRHIVVADTDGEARRIAKPNIEYHSASLNYLRKTQPSALADPRANVHRGMTFEEWETDGMAIAGSPATVLAAIERQAAELGINYLLSYLFFGTMTLEQALRSLELFRAEVMPRLAEL
jgi:alkanesulfonate monooxygenase SsuD/methylene tetrahydromethanopterin reductase-like flavin-dependent oxidoreductase (luciferase family)